METGILSSPPNTYSKMRRVGLGMTVAHGKKFSTQKSWAPMLRKNPGEALARIIRFSFVHYQHPPWFSVSIGKPAPKFINEPFIFFVHVDGGFGWVDKAQYFWSAGRFGAVWFKPGLFRIFYCGIGLPLPWPRKKRETAENHDVDKTLFDRVIPCSITNNQCPMHSHWTRFLPCAHDRAHRTTFFPHHDSRLCQFFWPG